MLRITAVVASVFLLALGASAQQNQPGTAGPQPSTAGSSVGSGSEANRPAPDAGAGAEAPPRSATNDIDKDRGIPDFASGNCRPVYSSGVERVGPVTGDPEKDTVGRVIIGTTCRQ